MTTTRLTFPAVSEGVIHREGHLSLVEFCCLLDQMCRNHGLEPEVLSNSMRPERLTGIGAAAISPKVPFPTSEPTPPMSPAMSTEDLLSSPAVTSLVIGQQFGAVVDPAPTSSHRDFERGVAGGNGQSSSTPGHSPPITNPRIVISSVQDEQGRGGLSVPVDSTPVFLGTTDYEPSLTSRNEPNDQICFATLGWGPVEPPIPSSPAPEPPIPEHAPPPIPQPSSLAFSGLEAYSGPMRFTDEPMAILDDMLTTTKVIKPSFLSTTGPETPTLPNDDVFSVFAGITTHQTQRASRILSQYFNMPPEPTESEIDASRQIQLRLEAKQPAQQANGGGKIRTKIGNLLRRSKSRSQLVDRENQNIQLTQVLDDVAGEGNLDLVKTTISMGAMLSTAAEAERNRSSALQRAVKGGHTAIANLLLQHDVRFPSPSRPLPPPKSTFRGRSRKKHVEEIQTSISPLDDALISAAEKGHTEMAVCLALSHGANPCANEWLEGNWEEKRESRSFIAAVAALKNREQAATILRRLNEGCKLDTTAVAHRLQVRLKDGKVITQGLTLASYCVRIAWANGLQVLLQDAEPGSVPLTSRGKFGDDEWVPSPLSQLKQRAWKSLPDESLDILKLLIDMGVDANESYHSMNGDTHHPLYHAITGGSEEATIMLLNANRDHLHSTFVIPGNDADLYSCIGLALRHRQWDIALAVLTAFKSHQPFLIPAREVISSDRSTKTSYLHMAISTAGRKESPPAPLLDALFRTRPPVEDVCASLHAAFEGRQLDTTRTLLSHYSARAKALGLHSTGTDPQLNLLLLLADTRCPVRGEHDSERDFVDAQRKYLAIIEAVVAFAKRHGLKMSSSGTILAAIRTSNATLLRLLVELRVLAKRDFAKGLREEDTPLYAAQNLDRARRIDEFGLDRYNLTCEVVSEFMMAASAQGKAGSGAIGEALSSSFASKSTASLNTSSGSSSQGQAVAHRLSRRREVRTIEQLGQFLG